MSLKKRRALLISSLIILGWILGRLCVRAVLNMLLGGTMFGGDLL